MSLISLIECLHALAPFAFNEPNSTVLSAMLRLRAAELGGDADPDPLAFGEMSLRKAIDGFRALSVTPAVMRDRSLVEECGACAAFGEVLLRRRQPGCVW